jgi:hypothetical protein
MRGARVARRVESAPESSPDIFVSGRLHRSDVCSLNTTTALRQSTTGRPLRVPGSNLQLRRAWRAAALSSAGYPLLISIETSSTSPVVNICSDSVTVPSWPARLATTGYACSGKVLGVRDGTRAGGGYDRLIVLQQRLSDIRIAGGRYPARGASTSISARPPRCRLCQL